MIDIDHRLWISNNPIIFDDDSQASIDPVGNDDHVCEFLYIDISCMYKYLYIRLKIHVRILGSIY